MLLHIYHTNDGALYPLFHLILRGPKIHMHWYDAAESVYVSLDQYNDQLLGKIDSFLIYKH